jgi:hypothetical protein
MDGNGSGSPGGADDFDDQLAGRYSADLFAHEF